MYALLHGIILGITVALPVGPTNIEVIRRGLKEGWKAVAVFCSGVEVALFTYLILVIFGLSFLTKSKIFNQTLLLFGVGVLFYLAYNAIKDFFNKKEFDFTEHGSCKKHFLPGIFLTIANPGVLMIWTGIMGADLAASGSSVGRGLYLSFGVLIGVGFFFAVLISLIHGGRRFLNKTNFRYVTLIAGLILLFFAMKFGYNFVTTVSSLW